MFEDMFDEINSGAKQDLKGIREHLKLLMEKKEEGTQLLSAKLDSCGGRDVLIDSVMLCPGTAPFEWDPDINEKLGLGGEPVVLQVCIPKSIAMAFALKNKVYADVHKEQVDTHASTRSMLQLLFMKGVASFIHDEEGMRDKLMARQLMGMMEQLRKSHGNEDDD